MGPLYLIEIHLGRIFGFGFRIRSANTSSRKQIDIQIILPFIMINIDLEDLLSGKSFDLIKTYFHFKRYHK